MVNDDGTAGRQVHRARKRGLDLVLNLKAAEQRRVVAVALHLVCRLGHHVAHELLRLVVDVVGVDQNFTDIGGEVIANGADDQRAFLVNQERTFARFGSAVNGVPQLEHVVQVPLQLGRAAANASGARDQAHAFGVFELFKVFFQLFALFAFNASAHTAAARVVGHQHQVAASQADHGGERCAFVAALFFFNLHQQLVTVFDGVLDACGAHVHAFAEVVA